MKKDRMNEERTTVIPLLSEAPIKRTPSIKRALSLVPKLATS